MSTYDHVGDARHHRSSPLRVGDRTAQWWLTVRARLLAADRDRGDVPGWVLVTLMTAGLVLALWALAGPALTGVFSDSIARVTGEIGG